MNISNEEVYYISMEMQDVRDGRRETIPFGDVRKILLGFKVDEKEPAVHDWLTAHWTFRAESDGAPMHTKGAIAALAALESRRTKFRGHNRWRDDALWACVKYLEVQAREEQYQLDSA